MTEIVPHFCCVRELRARLSDHVHRYNSLRIHSTPGCMSPVEFWEAGPSLPESSKQVLPIQAGPPTCYRVKSM
ncbi:IS3 family transposase [Collinsella bouchesdurhonensis]|uniref:IS3 family transposase n=1 Tax=Collinsella bouchesdurhonensis TaxID=1907654 RepID=UPI00356AE906